MEKPWTAEQCRERVRDVKDPLAFRQNAAKWLKSRKTYKTVTGSAEEISFWRLVHAWDEQNQEVQFTL